MDAFNQIMEEAEIRPQIMQIECHPFAQRQETRALAAQYGMQVVSDRTCRFESPGE